MLPTPAQVRIKRLRSSPVGYRLARGAFWSTISELMSRALGIVTFFTIARVLGREVFGELGVIQSTVAMFGTVAGFGLGMTATKHVAELRTSDPVRAGRVIGITTLASVVTGTTLAAVMVILGPWLASSALAAPHLAATLQVSSLLLLLGAVNGAHSGAMWGFEAFRRMAVVNTWSAFLSFPIMVAATIQWGLQGAIWSLILSRAGSALLTYRALCAEAQRSDITVSYRGLRHEWTLLHSYSLPAVASGLVVMFGYWACNALLANSPNGYAELGLFNAANQWFNVLIMIPGTLGAAVLPVLAGGAESSSQSRKVLTVAMWMNAAIVVPIALVGSALSPYIMRGYGPDFGGGWPALILVFGTAVLLAIQTPVGQVIAAAGRMWLGTLMNTGWAVIFIALTWLLTADGATGLALARFLAYIAHGVWTFWFAATVLRRSSTAARATSQPAAAAVDYRS
jgi:O-antigen/teichoic acid export membrane protein